MNSALEFFHYPFVFCDKRIYDLFHNEVWSQLFLFQIRSCHGIKMANTLRKKKKEKWLQIYIWTEDDNNVRMVNTDAY